MSLRSKSSAFGIVLQKLADFGDSSPRQCCGKINRARGDTALLAELATLTEVNSGRARRVDAMQRHIVTAYVSLYFSVTGQGHDPNAVTWQFIQVILENVACGKAGPIAEYLVGRKVRAAFSGQRYPKQAIQHF